MLWEVFVMGGFFFWLLFVAELVFVVGCLHFRRGGLATVSLGIFLLAMWLLGDFNVFVWVWRHPVLFAWSAGLYVAVAALWGFLKWSMYHRDNSYRYLELRSRFLRQNNVEGGQMPAHLKVTWADWFNHHNRPGDWESEVEFNPLPSEHKSTIIGWMIFWPISMAWTLIDDAVIKLFRHIYYMMYNWLEGIRKYYWGRFEADMPTAQEREAHFQRQLEDRNAAR